MGPLLGAGVVAGFGLRATFLLTGLVLLAVSGAVVSTTRRSREREAIAAA